MNACLNNQAMNLERKPLLEEPEPLTVSSPNLVNICSFQSRSFPHGRWGLGCLGFRGVMFCFGIRVRVYIGH